MFVKLNFEVDWMDIKLCNIIDFILNYKLTTGVELFHFWL